MKRRAGEFYNRDEELQRLMKDWLVANYLATSSADKAYGTTFMEIRAYYPIKRFLSKISCPNIEIYYGQHDWMNPMHTFLTLRDFSTQFGGEFNEGKWERLKDMYERPLLGEG